MGITQEEADVLGAEFLYGSWITKPPKVKWKKIYPNGLCPSGSGKKYKKCCER